MQFKRPSYQTVAVLGLLPILAACSHSALESASLSNAERAAAALNSKIVARVNGQEITASQLQQAEKIALNSKPGMQIPPNLLKDFEQQILNQLVSAELLYQASQKMEDKDLERKAETKIAQIRKGYATPEEYARKLSEIDMDQKAFAQSVRHDLAIADFVNSTIAAKVTVSEEEIKKFYEQNPNSFNLPEQVRASHILVGVDPKGGAGAKKAAREKAEKLQAGLLKGTDFATLARENSTCPSGKQGGDLGFFPKGRMEPAFEKAAFALKPGDVSEVVETRFGYHVIRVTGRKKAEVVSLDEARKRIEEFLRTQKTKLAVDTFVGSQRAKSKIEFL